MIAPESNKGAGHIPVIVVRLGDVLDALVLL